VQSRLGRGSIFTVSLPVVPSGRAQQSAPSKQPSSKAHVEEPVESAES
jgi:hypothetical protein